MSKQAFKPTYFSTDYIDTTYATNNIVYTHTIRLDNEHEIKQFKPAKTTVKDNWGSTTERNCYSLKASKTPAIREIQDRCRTLATELEKTLGYKSVFLTEKAQIRAGEEETVNAVRFTLSINHNTKNCWNTIVLTHVPKQGHDPDENPDDFEPEIIPYEH